MGTALKWELTEEANSQWGDTGGGMKRIGLYMSIPNKEGNVKRPPATVTGRLGGVELKGGRGRTHDPHRDARFGYRLG
jgi:hypothetical protein